MKQEHLDTLSRFLDGFNVLGDRPADTTRRIIKEGYVSTADLEAAAEALGRATGTDPFFDGADGPDEDEDSDDEDSDDEDSNWDDDDESEGDEDE